MLYIQLSLSQSRFAALPEEGATDSRKRIRSRRSAQRRYATSGRADSVGQPGDRSAGFDALVAVFSADPSVELPGPSRAKFGSNALKVNGRIFAMLVRGSLMVKLPKERVAALIASGRGEAFNAGRGLR